MINARRNRLDDPARLDVLRRTALLDASADIAFDRLTRLATRLLDAPVALVSLVDAHRQVFKGAVGLPEPWLSRRETPLSHSFCQHVVASSEPLVIADARAHPLVCDNLAIPDLDVVAYAGIPLVTADGHVLGSFCAIDDAPRDWSAAEIETLQDLAAAAMTEIQLRAAVVTAQEELAARRRAEAVLRATDERLSLAAEAGNVGTWELDIATGALTCSARCKANFGLPADAPLTYEALVALIHPEDRPAVRAAVEHALAARERYESEYRVVWPDGSLHWIAASGRGVDDEQGRPALLAGVTVDVTDRHRAVEEHQAFVEAVAHDLRNPLTAVKAQAQLLTRRLRRAGDAAPAGLADGLRAVEDGAGRATALIQELLDAAHLRAGRTLEVRREAIDVVALARAAIAESQATTGTLTLRLETSEDTLVGVVDRARLERVLANLLSNAIAYSPDGGEIVVAVTREARMDGPWAVLTVRDPGIGIPAADLPHVFERFRRGANVAGRFGGTGIGLAGAKQIVAQHGGTIAVASTEGAGTTVTVALPLAPPRSSTE